MSKRRVLYVQYTNPGGYPPLEHSSHILADAGWQVLFLGTGAFGSDALRLPSHPGVSLRQISYHRSGWRQKLHYAWFSGWVLAWTLLWRPTWVYASDLLACPAALLISCLPGLRILYHEHDTPATASTGAITRMCAWSRRRLAARADLCVLPNAGRVAQFGRTLATDSPAMTVWNCPRRDEVGLPRRPLAGPRLDVVYHGSIAPIRLPVTVLQALALLPNTVHLHVIGYETVGHQGYVQILQNAALGLGVEGRIHFQHAVPRSDLLRRTGGYRVGLSLMPNSSEDENLRFMSGASNKTFDYLARGLALLVSDLPDWRELYVDPGYGLACNPEDPSSIAAALSWFLEHPAETVAMGERGRQRIASEWNYETQFSPVLDYITKMTSAS
jgi:glycosyltransferase involved in cell wall biosynthesis